MPAMMLDEGRFCGPLFNEPIAMNSETENVDDKDTDSFS
jgi:hypothetical protein